MFKKKQNIKLDLELKFTVKSTQIVKFTQNLIIQNF